MKILDQDYMNLSQTNGNEIETLKSLMPWDSVSTCARKHGMTEATLRAYLQNRKTNGLDSAVRTIGKRRILISEPLFLQWIVNSNEENN